MGQLNDYYKEGMKTSKKKFIFDFCIYYLAFVLVSVLIGLPMSFLSYGLFGMVFGRDWIGALLLILSPLLSFIFALLHEQDLPALREDIIPHNVKIIHLDNFMERNIK